MPCNCKKCDCKSRELCYYIESRIKLLICIFDKLADGSIPLDGDTDTLFGELFDDFGIGNARASATAIDAAELLLCGSGLSGVFEGSAFKTFKGIDVPSSGKIGIYMQGVRGGTVNLLDNLSGLKISDFLPTTESAARDGIFSNISEFEAIITTVAVFFAVLCIPTPDESGFCLRCTPIITIPENVCELPDLSILPNIGSIFNGTDTGAIGLATALIQQYFAALAQNLRYWVTLYGCS
jgi:hypothetical protein